MISEPELVGGGGFERPEVLTEAPPPRPPRAHRPWLPFKVTVTDPEDGTIDCSRVKVTFIVGHDSHG
ncbi:hypothetical protein, partial [Streptomyces sp. NPDC096068]|uniref:hypothetical protein n=1 Tax=Streptomyces sp. NPDC096068 TaxID=3155424 RepID=UPI00332546A5